MKIRKNITAIAVSVLLLGMVLLIQVLETDYKVAEVIKEPLSAHINQDYEAEYEHAEVIRVKDGDTIEVTLDGTKETVRLIGIDCPESVHPNKSKNSQEGDLASKYTKEALPEGTIVYLEKDYSDRDKYGRLLRYVWIEQPLKSYDFEEIENKLLNAILVKEGHAIPKEYPPDTKYSVYLSKLA